MQIPRQDLLLVEDDAREAELLLQEFAALQFRERIQVLRAGAELLALLFGETPPPANGDLPRAILLGWKPPGPAALAVLRRLKGEERTRRIPTFLLLSSLQDVATLTREPVQPDGWLVKPVGFADFVRQLVPAVGRRFQLNPVRFVPKQ
jgi:two-component system response regulator